VSYNNAFYEMDPDPAVVPEQDRWWLFKQDMLQMRHAGANWMLDLGWYPEGDLLNEAYGLVVHKGDFHGPELHSFSTRSRIAVVTKIERLLMAAVLGET
jgi:hypothetical protein